MIAKDLYLPGLKTLRIMADALFRRESMIAEGLGLSGSTKCFAIMTFPAGVGRIGFRGIGRRGRVGHGPFSVCDQWMGLPCPEIQQRGTFDRLARTLGGVRGVP